MPPDEMIDLLSKHLLRLDSGSLAELRRIEIGGAGPLPFWRLAAECGFLDSDANVWMHIVQILAILAPKGERLHSDRLHDLKRRFGAVLCDGGDPGWTGGGGARPFFSEARLARLLAKPAEQRADALTRTARMLASSRDRASGINCQEIAALLLLPKVESPLQAIARAYYQRLDSATRKAEQKGSQQ
jgi:CRISPR system Cascade subunit CasB